MTIWKPGRRLFSTAAILMLLMAAAHSAGNIQGPLEPPEQKLFSDMDSFRSPLGLGMTPSVKDFFFAMGWTVSLTFAALGSINLSLAAISETPDRVFRRVSWMNALWLGALLFVACVYRVPPPLISAVIIEVVVIASLFKRTRLA
ncbi:MAG TPA: hypothetical protein VGV35_09340 [Bryobacteraceae bacterium]|nr:hypothetical protein [Bryobacteraceae bacterium]